MKTIRDYILEHGLDTIDFDSHYSKRLPKNCTRLFKDKTIDADEVESFDTSEVENMVSMFSNCKDIKSLDLSGWDTSNVKTMSCVFLDCTSLESLDLSGWNVSNVEEMPGMFNYCTGLKSLDLSGWDTSNVVDMWGMFEGCNNLKSLDLSGWDTSKLEYINNLFYNCQSLESLDLSGWDTSKLEYISNLFYNCHNLTDIKFGPGWGKQQNDVTLSLKDCGSKKGYKLSDETWNSMLTMYDRKKTDLKPIEIVLNKQHNIPDGWKQQMEAKGYEILVY